MKRRTPDPLDPDQTGAWATPNTFQQCANSQCQCRANTEPIDQGDIE